MPYSDRDTISGSREDRMIKTMRTLTVSGMALLLITFMSILFVNPQQIIAQISNNSTNTILTYQNPDIGLSMQYPSDWIKHGGNPVQHTIAALLLKHQSLGGLDFTNITLAEVDIRVFPAPQGLTPGKLNFTDVPTQGQAVLSHYKNSTTTLGGLPGVRVISYIFGGVTNKVMQMWTVVPSKHIYIEVIYYVQPAQYSLYLPAVEKIIDSIKIAH